MASNDIQTRFASALEAADNVRRFLTVPATDPSRLPFVLTTLQAALVAIGADMVAHHTNYPLSYVFPPKPQSRNLWSVLGRSVGDGDDVRRADVPPPNPNWADGPDAAALRAELLPALLCSEELPAGYKMTGMTLHDLLHFAPRRGGPLESGGPVAARLCVFRAAAPGRENAEPFWGRHVPEAQEFAPAAPYDPSLGVCLEAAFQAPDAPTLLLRLVVCRGPVPYRGAQAARVVAALLSQPLPPRELAAALFPGAHFALGFQDGDSTGEVRLLTDVCVDGVSLSAAEIAAVASQVHAAIKPAQKAVMRCALAELLHEASPLPNPDGGGQSAAWRCRVLPLVDIMRVAAAPALTTSAIASLTSLVSRASMGPSGRLDDRSGRAGALALTQQGEALEAAGRYTEAIEVYKTLLARPSDSGHPFPPVAWEYLALAYKRAGDWARCDEAYERGLQAAEWAALRRAPAQ